MIHGAKNFLVLSSFDIDRVECLGDWEMDTIIGKGYRHDIVLLVERKTNLALLRKIEHKTAQAMADAVIELMKSLTVRNQTITAGKSKEIVEQERIKKELNTDVYFAYPPYPGSELLMNI